ncbi:DUF4105 domain-containing protein [Patescibacteria group bacterium]|jgi:hypothetical protein|nr:DUF4105 domain-containing protein [Patescibacteria group bacterium]
METFFVGSVLALAYFILGRLRRRPTHDREWELDVSHLPRVSRKGGEVTIYDLRDWAFTRSGAVAHDTWRDVRFDRTALTRAWLVVEPFVFWGKIAHTFLIFELASGDAVGVSVEARKRKDQRYSPVMALFRSYELIYQWGSARDLLSVRALRRRHTQYLVPLKLSDEQVQDLFGAMVAATNELFRAPRFYNTVRANCTTELFDPIAKIDPAFRLSLAARLLTARIHWLLRDRGLVAPGAESIDVTPHILDMDPAIREDADPSHFFRALTRSLYPQPAHVRD